jgi:hypothetical protein
MLRAIAQAEAVFLHKTTENRADWDMANHRIKKTPPESIQGRALSVTSLHILLVENRGGVLVPTTLRCDKVEALGAI